MATSRSEIPANAGGNNLSQHSAGKSSQHKSAGCPSLRTGFGSRDYEMTWHVRQCQMAFILPACTCSQGRCSETLRYATCTLLLALDSLHNDRISRNFALSLSLQRPQSSSILVCAVLNLTPVQPIRIANRLKFESVEFPSDACTLARLAQPS